MNMTGKLERLQQACSGVKMRCQEPLAEHTSFRIGGPADLMLFPSSEEELAQILRACQRLELKPVILGAGTNVLAPDEGLRGGLHPGLPDGHGAARRDGDRREKRRDAGQSGHVRL